MARLVEYKIISGRVAETRRCYMSVRSILPKSKRAPRVAGNSNEQKIKANELSSKREAARVLNCNMIEGDVHLICKYDAEHYPESYEAAVADFEKTLARARYQAKKQGIEDLKIFWVNANWSPKRNAPARWHHHVVCSAAGFELFKKAWKGGGFWCEWLDSRADHSELGFYLVENVHVTEANQRRWHCTRNMERPIYTEPVEVEEIEGLQPEKGEIIKEFTENTDEDGRVVSSYMRCVLPYRAKVRGGKVIKPRNEKRRKRK